MSLLKEIGLVAIEEEAVRGVAETLVAADVVQVTEPGYSPGIDIAPRNTFEPTFAKRPSNVGNRMATMTFAIPVHGSGTNDLPPLFRDALVGCALEETINAAVDVDYDPVADLTTQKTVTIAMQRDGKRYLIHGAAGNAKFIVNENETPRWEYTFIGVYDVAVDEALFTGFTFGAINPPDPVGVTATWDGNTLCASNFEFDLGNDVQPVRCITEATGVRYAAVVDRTPVLTVDPEEELVATVDWVDEMVQATIGAFNFVLGTVAGNIHTVQMLSSQIVNVTFGERDGIIIANLTIEGRANSDAGNDELQYSTS